ncbi:hypothetical protein SAMN04488109_5577 [Chryseolinea serpens]|uniref:Uncharacterized protein n=1 Tax=Chryseolinea serpens TaxID=947013 RepID=A0A1M5W1V5_9BACT|nr:hypothetical protein [Chryseolinea serpens]SHH81183.1 hypothetical protein SAMN04488109_5577 [Chryseolinea serpens]
MRITKIALVAMVVMLLGCDTGNKVDPVFQDYFIKYYGEDGNQEGVDIYVNGDGSMILLGNSSSLTELSIPFIVKTDSLGNVLWQHQMGGRNEKAVDVELIPSGIHQGKLVVVSNVGTDTESKIRITIVDQSGKGIDSLILDTDKWQTVKSVTPSSDSDFIVCGNAAPDPDRNAQPSPDDHADIISLRVDQSLTTVDTLSWQGGEHEGFAVKVFEVPLQGETKYALFGYSDRKKDEQADFEDKFEVIVVNVDGLPSGVRVTTGQSGQKQKASQAIRVPASQEDGFFMIGTNEDGSNRDIFVTKYSKDLSMTKLAQTLPFGGKMEGVAVASAIREEGYFLLANEIQDNNNRNIFLVHIRLDGSKVWSTSFGNEDGDDTAGAVAALKDGRIAVLGTIDLETQKKMALIIVNKNGGFSN